MNIYYVFLNLFGLLFELVSLTFFAAPVYRIYYAISLFYCCCCWCCLSYLFAYGKVKLRRNSSRVVISGLPPSSLGLILSLYSYFMMCMLLLFILLHNILRNTQSHTLETTLPWLPFTSICLLWIYFVYIAHKFHLFCIGFGFFFSFHLFFAKLVGIFKRSKSQTKTYRQGCI